jgi:hypothetical protein
MRYITYSFALSLLSLLSSLNGKAQQFLTGKVFKKGSTEGLLSVSIHNITSQRYDLSEEDGSYHIQAAPGDHIAFSSVGYKADTLTVTASILTASYPIYLDIRPVTLQSVRVGELSNYQLDSIDRHKEYSWVYDRSATEHIAKERQGDGVGIEMNIFRNTSTAARERTRLLKRLQKEEQDDYVDSRYSESYVSKYTHLTGDSLKAFMKKYRPSYDYCRKAATVDILVYINDCYKLYLKGE